MTLTAPERRQLNAAIASLEAEAIAQQSTLQALTYESAATLAKLAELYRTVDGMYRSPWIGGDPGERNQVVIEGQTITATIPSGTTDVDYVNCTFMPANGRIMDGRYWGVRILGGVARGLRPLPEPQDAPKFVFVNNDYPEVPSGVVIQDLVMEDCAAEIWGEFKATEVVVGGVRYANTPVSREDIRFRHGTRNLCMNCPDFESIAVRGYDHAVIGCGKAKVRLYAGNLPPRYDDYKSLVVKGGSNNMHSSAGCCVSGVAVATVGTLAGKPISSPGPGKPGNLYRASGHVIAPDVLCEWGTDAVSGVLHEGTAREDRRPAWLAERLKGSVFA